MWKNLRLCNTSCILWKLLQPHPTLNRTVGRSENPGGLVVLGLLPLIGLGLTYLPKSGGGGNFPLTQGSDGLFNISIIPLTNYLSSYIGQGPQDTIGPKPL